jgi:sugar/nucleoside kinase (ribokinase family)
LSLLVVGSIAYDDIESPHGKRTRIPGGSATYFCHAARFFTQTRLVGVVGEDYEHFDLLKSLNADLEGVKVAPGKTFHYGCRYEEDMNIRTTLFTHLGVFEEFQPELPTAYRSSNVVFLANIHPDLQNSVLDQVDGPDFVAADSMNLWIDIALDSLKRLLGRINMLIINDEESALLTGERHVPKAARLILDMGPDRVIIKRGEYGSAMFSDEGMFFAPAYPVVNAVDPTGAGDSFAGGVMGYLAGRSQYDESTIRSSIIHGSAIGGFAVEGFGFDRLKHLTIDEIDDRVQEFTQFTSIEI